MCERNRGSFARSVGDLSSAALASSTLSSSRRLTIDDRDFASHRLHAAVNLALKQLHSSSSSSSSSSSLSSSSFSSSSSLNSVRILQPLPKLEPSLEISRDFYLPQRNAAHSTTTATTTQNITTAAGSHNVVRPILRVDELEQSVVD